MQKSNPRVILVGGGLANCLIALLLRERRPEVDLWLLEAAPLVGGHHTWSFFEADVGTKILGWLDPLLVKRWPGYEVRFPSRRRRLMSPYASITSERLAAVVADGLGARLRTGMAVAVLEANRVILADGEVLYADAVIDGRGPGPMPEIELGYQKFVGQLVRLRAPHGLTMPIIMDATMSQIDGYRFLYTLPFDALHLLIEDTRYADGAAVDHADFLRGIQAYADSQGWAIDAIEAQEEGVLPVVLDGDIDAFWQRDPGLPRVGLRAALFHPTTGYSLPDAARLAEAIAAAPAMTSAALATLIRANSVQLWQSRGYFRALNRMLFRAGEPAARYRIMQRFYGLSADLIARFYAADLTFMNKLRILIGKPPVSMRAALGVGLKLWGKR